MRFDWPGVVQIGVFVAPFDGQTIKLVEGRKALFFGARKWGKDVFINGLRAYWGDFLSCVAPDQNSFEMELKGRQRTRQMKASCLKIKSKNGLLEMCILFKKQKILYNLPRSR